MTGTPKPYVFMATLGLAPQVVTLALDHLLPDYPFVEVCVIHTDETQERMRPVIQRLDGEFQRFHQHPTPVGEKKWDAVYRYRDSGYLGTERSVELVYRRVLIQRPEPQPRRLPRQVPVPDVETPENSEATFRTIYRVANHYKQDNAIIHFCIAGGRKSMAVFGLATAQTLFDQSDKVWHVVSKEEFMDTREMHDLEDKSRLVPVDVIYLSEYLAAKGLIFDDPYKVIRAQRRYLQEVDQARKERFLRALDPVQRQILVGVCQLLENDEIGTRLSPTPLSGKRVANILTELYRRYWEFVDLPAEERKNGRGLLIKEFANYFQTRGEQL